MYGLWHGGVGQIAPRVASPPLPSLLAPAQPRAISAPRNGIPQGGWLKHFSPCMIFGQGFPLAGVPGAKSKRSPACPDSHDEPRLKIS